MSIKQSRKDCILIKIVTQLRWDCLFVNTGTKENLYSYVVRNTNSCNTIKETLGYHIELFATSITQYEDHPRNKILLLEIFNENWFPSWLMSLVKYFCHIVNNKSI